MIDFYCWCQNISKKDYQKILDKSSVCCKEDSKYKEKFNELCIILNSNKLKEQNVDDIFNDLEGILQRKIDCHVNVCNSANTELSVIQKNGKRTITSMSKTPSTTPLLK